MASQAKRGVNAAKENAMEDNPYFLNPYDYNNSSSKANDKINFKAQQVQENYKMHGSRKSTSKAKSQFNYSKSGSSNYTASIRQRIEKACTTNSTIDLQKQNALLSRQIDRLEREILRKDQQIIEMRTQVMPSKETKTQIMELYRALNYYQGKIKEMETQILKFRDMILKAPGDGVTAQNLNVLFEDLRRDNEELSAQIHQIQFERNSIDDNYNRLKTKFYESQRELAQYKRRQNSPLQQYYLASGTPVKAATNPKINMLFHQMISKNAPSDLEVKEKELIKRDLQLRLEQSERKLGLAGQEAEYLHQEIDKLKVQNEILQNELDDKSRHVTELFKDFMSAKKSLKKLQSQIHSERVLPQSSELSWTPSAKHNIVGLIRN